MMTNYDEVWTEVKIDSEGISIALYGMTETFDPIDVLDKWWATHDEMESLATDDGENIVLKE